MWHSDWVTDPDLAALADAVRAAAEARARHRRLGVQLETTGALVETRRSELAELQRRLQVEQSDVRRLETVSPTKIWATLRGDAADRLAIERAEADAARLAVAGAQARLDSAIADAAGVCGERDVLRGADDAYGDALAAYEVALRAAGGRDAVELTAIADQLGVAAARQREITEAFNALRATKAALDEALAKLDNAGGWSTYDTLFGGGFVADIVKHSNISEATDAFTEVNRALERLSTELADLEVSTVDGVEISETLAVFDVLFDNILSDWMVLDRISEARAGAEKLDDRLTQLAEQLSASAEETSTRIGTLLGQREAILTAA
jgi:DNA repair exonuclease SbcCD ATPase subunit